MSLKRAVRSLRQVAPIYLLSLLVVALTIVVVILVECVISG
jgi:hypothetical protein